MIYENKMKILIFTEGTIIMHKEAFGLTKQEIIKQVKEKELSVHDYPSYIPIGSAALKIKEWKKQGVGIVYLTSRKELNEIEDIKKVLQKYDFPEGEVLYRKENEEYKDVAEMILPDILIEDDCESIGGKDEMTITKVNPKIKQKIKSIIIEEFGGIDYLPDDINLLKNF